MRTEPNGVSSEERVQINRRRVEHPEPTATLTSHYECRFCSSKLNFLYRDQLKCKIALMTGAVLLLSPQYQPRLEFRFGGSTGKRHRSAAGASWEVFAAVLAFLIS